MSDTAFGNMRGMMANDLFTLHVMELIPEYVLAGQSLAELTDSADLLTTMANINVDHIHLMAQAALYPFDWSYPRSEHTVCDPSAYAIYRRDDTLPSMIQYNILFGRVRAMLMYALPAMSDARIDGIVACFASRLLCSASEVLVDTFLALRAQRTRALIMAHPNVLSDRRYSGADLALGSIGVLPAPFRVSLPRLTQRVGALTPMHLLTLVKFALETEPRVCFSITSANKYPTPPNERDEAKLCVMLGPNPRALAASDTPAARLNNRGARDAMKNALYRYMSAVYPDTTQEDITDFCESVFSKLKVSAYNRKGKLCLEP